jgi:hypothetical protein
MTENELLNQITEEYNSWVDSQYANNDKNKRKELGQFYTPPTLIMRLLDKFGYNSDDFKNKKIIDPTSGAGGLLIGCYYAGANIENLYGIELDKNILENVCWKRLDRIIDNDIEHNWSDEKKKQLKDLIRKHIHWGNALDKRCYSFDDDEKSEEYTEWVKEQDNIEKEKQEKRKEKIRANIAKSCPCIIPRFV